MRAISNALSALQAYQVALDTTSHNIANAATAGYHRQRVSFQERPPSPLGPLLVGNGVEVGSIRAIRNDIVEAALTENISDASATDRQLAIFREIESLFQPGPGSLNDRFNSFFDEVERLTARPNDPALRGLVVQAGQSLADSIRFTYQRLEEIRQTIRIEADSTVEQINQHSRMLIDLNREIRAAEVHGGNANDLRNQRGRIVNELAALIDVGPASFDGASLALRVANGGVAIDNSELQLQLQRETDGSLRVVNGDGGEGLTVIGGSLAAILDADGNALNQFESALDDFAYSLMSSVDELHATDVNATGYTQLNSSRSVNDITIPLDQADLPLPISAGSLFVTVRNDQLGTSETTEIAIDPATQSLQDVAAAISSVTHMQALVNAQAGQITLVTEPGYSFDFAGRLATEPSAAAITGTSVAEIAGRYTGTANDEFEFVVSNTGTVGLTPGLSVDVFDANGNIVTSLDVGLGYEPGSELDVADGVRVKLGPGTLNTGDRFSALVVGESDSAGLLTGLGINTFFRGSGARNIGIAEHIESDPRQLSFSEIDNANIRRLVRSRDELLFHDGTKSLADIVIQFTTDSGALVAEADEERDFLTTIGQRIESELQAISGVDINEEMLHLLDFQRSFQAAARTITVVNNTLDEILSIVR